MIRTVGITPIEKCQYHCNSALTAERKSLFVDDSSGCEWQQRVYCVENSKNLGDCLSGEGQNEEVAKKIAQAREQKNKGPLAPLVDVIPENIIVALAEMEMLQIIFFSILFGIVLLMIDPKAAKPVNKLMNGLNEVFITRYENFITRLPWQLGLVPFPVRKA